MNTDATKTGLLVLTHGNIGRSLIEVAEFILSQSLEDVEVLSFRQSAMEETDDDEIGQAIKRADRGRGILILTDVGGASPCNHATRFRCSEEVAVVSGLNLAMLIRAWSYRQNPPRELADLATEGAIRDIKACRS